MGVEPVGFAAAARCRARMPQWVACCGLVGIVAMVGGCSQDHGPSTSPDTETAAAGLRSDPGSAFDGGDRIEIPGDTPFTAYSVYLDGPGAEDADYLKERTEWHDERERLIAGCMALEGFEYYPVEYQRLEGLDEVLSFDRDYLGIPLLPSTRAEVERWGYGEEAPLEFVTREGLTAGASAAQDENQRYVETLSAAAQAAYLTAYIGTADLAAALAEPGGCVAEADAGLPDEPVPEGPSERFRAQYGELAEEMARFGTSGVLEDARVAALASQWDKCMVGLGVDVSGETAPGVTMVTVPYANPNSARYLAMRTGSDGAVGAGGGGFFEDSLPVDQRSLVGSQAEARIALADFDCRAQTDYEARLLAVQLELEQEFVDENRAQLEEMVIAARGE